MFQSAQSECTVDCSALCSVFGLLVFSLNPTACLFCSQIRLVVEEGLNQLPYSECTVTTPTGEPVTMAINSPSSL